MSNDPATDAKRYHEAVERHQREEGQSAAAALERQAREEAAESAAAAREAAAYQRDLERQARGGGG